MEAILGGKKTSLFLYIDSTIESVHGKAYQKIKYEIFLSLYLFLPAYALYVRVYNAYIFKFPSRDNAIRAIKPVILRALLAARD